MTGLRHFRDLVDAVLQSPQLVQVRLLTRGFFREREVPGGAALTGWADEMRDYLHTKGVRFELLLVPRLHQRRCLFTGATGILEISTEWGLDFFLDSPENFQRAPHL